MSKRSQDRRRQRRDKQSRRWEPSGREKAPSARQRMRPEVIDTDNATTAKQERHHG
jgi:hypothetical protein